MLIFRGVRIPYKKIHQSSKASAKFRHLATWFLQPGVGGWQSPKMVFQILTGSWYFRHFGGIKLDANVWLFWGTSTKNGFERSVWVDNDPCTILRGTNSKSTWKWMVGRLKFPFGKAYFQGLCYIDLGRVSIKHVMPSNVFCSMNTYYWKDSHEANICFDSWNMWFREGKEFPCKPVSDTWNNSNKASTLNLQKIIKTFSRFWNDSIGWYCWWFRNPKANHLGYIHLGYI